MLAGRGAGSAAFEAHVVDRRGTFETITRLKGAGTTDATVAGIERLVE